MALTRRGVLAGAGFLAAAPAARAASEIERYRKELPPLGIQID